jgi:hypothetical protein
VSITWIDYVADLLVQPRLTRRAVTFVPSGPDSGGVLMPSVIDSDGSSTRDR